MSKLVWVNYRISDAEERETRRKIALLRGMLERCAALQQELQKLEPLSGENWGETLARYQTFVDQNRWREFTDDYNRLYEEIPAVERNLAQELTQAKAKRLRLELTAATLLASSITAGERSELSGISSKAAGLYAARFEDAVAKVNAILRRRLDTPLNVADPELTADQIALARDLLATSPQAPGFADSPQAEYQLPTQSGSINDADRINRLIEQISQIDPLLAPVDDLQTRLRQMPSRNAGDRALLIDSVTLEVKDRLDAARRKRDLQKTIDEGLSWLTPFHSLSADGHREHLAAALQSSDLTAARAAASDARVWAEVEGRLQDGARVRSVLLSELQELGYEVNVQGQAWDEGSRVTIQKPSEPNYDIQLSSAPGGAVQSKVRAYNHAGRSAGINRRDVEVEQSWCGDLARVNKVLAERGISSQIAHEDGPGNSAQIPLPAQHDRPMEIGRTGERERKA